MSGGSHPAMAARLEHENPPLPDVDPERRFALDPAEHHEQTPRNAAVRYQNRVANEAGDDGPDALGRRRIAFPAGRREGPAVAVAGPIAFGRARADLAPGPALPFAEGQLLEARIDPIGRGVEPEGG